jgi:hypoxanthine phosphoribosyltransferase
VTGGAPEATGTPPISGTPGHRAPDDLDAPQAPLELPEGDTVDGTRFAHASEAEMARILDFYAVRWEYEPTTFPILWNLDGDVVESFAPDFYLPELEMFLEMTTLKQRLVRKKNRKLRRLRELYPDIRIKLFYARDFRAMLLKYGRLALAEALSGTPGQVVPERAHSADAMAVEADAGMPVDVAGNPATGPIRVRTDPGARARPGRLARHPRVSPSAPGTPASPGDTNHPGRG